MLIFRFQRLGLCLWKYGDAYRYTENLYKIWDPPLKQYSVCANYVLVSALKSVAL